MQLHEPILLCNKQLTELIDFVQSSDLPEFH